MPVFRYRGVNENGKEVTGILEAESQKVAVLRIRKEGVFPFDIKEGEISQKRVSLDWEIDFKRYLKRIRIQDIALMTRQLSTLLSAGIPLVDSLNALKDQVEN